MPKFKVPKDTIEGPEVMPSGKYVVRLDGFKPALSKGKDSINYNPVLRVVAPEDYKDRNVYFNMNSNFGPAITDLAHGFGFKLEKDSDGDYVIPGEFEGPDEDMTRWAYKGPMLGKTAEIDLALDSYEGKDRNAILRFYCQVPECDTRHADSLIGKR